MEVERYKMIYTKIISEKLKWKLPNYVKRLIVNREDNLK